jgi:hypothetical protein
MMNTTIPPVPHLPIPILELCINQQVKDLTTTNRRLAALLAAMRAQQPSCLGEIITAATPTFEVIPHHFSRAVRRAQILAKRDEAVNQARQAFIRAAYPKITALSANGFQGLNCLTSQRIAEAAEVDKKTTITDEVVDFLAADIRAKAERAAKRAHAALLASPRRKKKEKFTDEALEEIKGRLLVEVNEWKQTSEAAGAALKKQTLKEYAAQVSSRPGFPHSHDMPRLRKNFCPHCAEVVVNGNSVLRETKGAYLPIEHECPKVDVVDGIPNIACKSVVVRPREFPSDEAAQNHFESKLVTFVGDGAELEVIDSFKYNPRANHSDQREKDLMKWAQRRSCAGVVVGPTCLRCKAPITKRKGTKYCSDDCRKRQWEKTNNQGELTSCQQQQELL